MYWRLICNSEKSAATRNRIQQLTATRVADRNKQKELKVASNKKHVDYILGSVCACYGAIEIIVIIIIITYLFTGSF